MSESASLCEDVCIRDVTSLLERGFICRQLAPATQHGFSVNEARCHDTEVQRQDCHDRGYTLGAVIRAGRSPITIRRGEVQVRAVIF